MQMLPRLERKNEPVVGQLGCFPTPRPPPYCLLLLSSLYVPALRLHHLLCFNSLLHQALLLGHWALPVGGSETALDKSRGHYGMEGWVKLENSLSLLLYASIL